VAVPQDDRQRELIEYDLGQATMSSCSRRRTWESERGTPRWLTRISPASSSGFQDRFCAYLVALGYPADRPLAPIERSNQRPFDEVVHRERW
jgi:nitroreductase